jgi:Arm DNA-binding domain
LTDRFLRSLPPAKHGTRNDIWDTVVPTFGVCVYDSKDSDPARRGKAAKVAFFMFTRFKRGAAPARRIIGIYGAITLEEARRTAGEWRSLIAKGIDPAAVEKANREKAAREAALRVQHAFSVVAETFIEDKLKQERDGKDAERVMRSTFVAAWAHRPIGEIGPLDVLEIINAKKRSAPQMARALMVLIRRFFNWACDAHVYGLTASPCDRLSVSRIIGPVPKRNRRLNDAEIFAFWRATGRMKYPVGPVYRMLLLSGLRLNECAALSWPEVQDDVIVIPPERMKAKDGTAIEHLVPITEATLRNAN